MATSTDRLLELIGLPAGGAVVGHLWTRFRSRLARLNWSVEHTPLAFGTEDFGIGKVEVLYNGTPVLNIHSTRILIQNDSSTDLTDLDINVRFAPGTSVLYSQGQLVDTPLTFPFTKDYAEALEKATKGTPTVPLATLATVADHTIPVLNRGAVATLVVFTSRQDYATPVVAVTTQHRGVRMVHRPPVPEAFGVRRSIAQVVGISLGLLLVGAAIVRNLGPLLVGFGGWFLGATLIALGAGAVQLLRVIRRLLS